MSTETSQSRKGFCKTHLFRQCLYAGLKQRNMLLQLLRILAYPFHNICGRFAGKFLIIQLGLPLSHTAFARSPIPLSGA